jgi:predicted N-acetyltransferase YhbS
LDFGNDKFELTDNENSVLVSSLSVNPQMQGRGIGKIAMMLIDDFVRKNLNNVMKLFWQ